MPTKKSAKKKPQTATENAHSLVRGIIGDEERRKNILPVTAAAENKNKKQLFCVLIFFNENLGDYNVF